MSVVRLRDVGRILKRGQLAPPMVGDLTISDWAPQGASGRWRRHACLLGRLVGQVRPNLFPPLFDVQVLKIDEVGMYLQGTEIEPRHPDLSSEHVQVWLCSPTNLDCSEQVSGLGLRERGEP